jgi:hypothetical protein
MFIIDLMILQSKFKLQSCTEPNLFHTLQTVYISSCLHIPKFGTSVDIYFVLIISAITESYVSCLI